MSSNPISGFDNEENARNFLLWTGIESLQNRAGFVPAVDPSELDESYTDFLKERDAPHTRHNMTRWATRGGEFGLKSPETMAIAGQIMQVERFYEIYGKKHPIQRLLQFEWYRNALRDLGLDDADPNQDDDSV